MDAGRESACGATGSSRVTLAVAQATATRTVAHGDNTEPPRGGPTGGGRATPPRHPKPPPTTLSHSACRPELETGGRGEGGQSRSPGAGQREWDLPIPAPGVDRPMHIGAGRRLFRRSPSNAAAVTVLGRAPQAAAFSGSRSSGCVVR